MTSRFPPSLQRTPLAIAAMFVPLAGLAQTPAAVLADTLPEVVVTTDRQQLPARQSASPVRVLAREALEDLPAKDAAEALATLPNVNIRRSGGLDGEPSLGMYGVSAQPRSSSSTTLAINGVPLNNGIFPEASLNILPLPLLERIEVIQGPASSAYGNNARLGVVNLVTQRPERLGGQVWGEVGRWNSRTLGATVGSDLTGGGSVLLGIEQQRSDGHLQPQGRADFSNSRRENVAAFIEKPLGDVLLSAAYLRYSWDRNNPSYLVQPGNPAAANPIGTPSARGEDGQREHFHVSAAYQLAPEWSTQLVYSYNDFDEQTVFHPAYGTPSGFGATTPTDQRAKSHTLSASATWETQSNLLTFGVDHQRADLVDRAARTTTNGRTTGWFLQNRYLALDRQLSLLVGYRQDSFSFYDETSRSPKVGFSYQPKGANWLVRGNVARAFSAPSFNQLFGSLGNTALVATTLTVRELGVQWWPSAGLQLGATVFATRTTDPIYPRPRNQNPICAPGAGNCFVNVGDVAETRGLTLDLRHRVSANWNWGGSWTYLDPKENTFATARHVLKLDTRYQSGPWTFSGTLRHESGRYFQDGHRSPFPDFTVVDAGLAYRFDRGFELAATLENVTDERYATTQIVSTSNAFAALPIYRPGRNLSVRGTWRF